MVITDSRTPSANLQAIGTVLQAGAPAIQLRWKDAAIRALLELGRELRIVTREAGALLIVNDRVDVAVAVGADGAHLGDDDLPLEVARRIAPEGFLLGRSVDTAAEALRAQDDGADYLGLGPIYPTRSKRDTGPVVGLDGIRAVRARIDIPLLGIGGIGPAEAAGVIRAGADGVAVMAAIMAAPDPRLAAAALLAEIRSAGNDDLAQRR